MGDQGTGKSGWLQPTWYQTLAAVSIGLLFVFAAKELWDAFILIGGLCLIGIGEWINHSGRFDTLPGMRAMKGWIVSRSPKWHGWLFDGLGALLFLIGSFRLLRHW